MILYGHIYNYIIHIKIQVTIVIIRMAIKLAYNSEIIANSNKIVSNPSDSSPMIVLK